MCWSRLSKVGFDLWGDQPNQVQQVLPVLAGTIRCICPLDDLPVDVEFLGFRPKILEQKIIERDRLKIGKPTKEFLFAWPHAAGANGQN